MRGGKKCNYCRLAVNITATNRLNYGAHVHVGCKLLHRSGLSATRLAISHRKMKVRR